VGQKSQIPVTLRAINCGYLAYQIESCQKRWDVKTSVIKESQSTVMLCTLCNCLQIRGAKNSGVVFENSRTLKMICVSFIINKKNINTFTCWCFSWNPDPGPIAYYVHTVRPWFNRAITCYAKAPVFPGFFPFRPKDGCSSIIEFVNNILFDIRSLVGLPQTGNTEAMISHVQIYSDKLSKIIG
jgi:hypothetical protein